MMPARMITLSSSSAVSALSIFRISSIGCSSLLSARQFADLLIVFFLAQDAAVQQIFVGLNLF